MKLRIALLVTSVCMLACVWSGMALGYSELQMTETNYNHINPRWDSQNYVVYQRGTSTDYKLYRVWAESETESSITPEAGGTTRTYPDPAPAGGEYTYLWKDNAGYNQVAITKWTGAVWDETMLTNTSEQHYSPKYSPAGNWIAYFKEVGGDYQIFRVAPTGGAEVQVTGLNFIAGDRMYPTWSPDGTYVVYERVGTDNVRRIYKKNATSGTTETKLTTADYNAYKPVWSPDGQRIAYHRWTGSQYHVYVVPFNGGTEVKVTGSNSATGSRMYPQWLSDSENLVYTFDDSATTGEHIYQADCTVTSPTETKLTSIADDHDAPCVSFDGKWIAYPLNYATYAKDEIFKAPTSTGRALLWSTGWVKGYEYNYHLAGVQLIGNTTNKEMTGIPSTMTGYYDCVLPHFAENSKWSSTLRLTNPDTVNSASVTLTAYDDAGALLGTQSVTVSKGGVWSGDVGTTFTITGKTGWIDVHSDNAVIVPYLEYGNSVDGGVAGLPAAPESTFFAMPHFAQTSAWWTGMSIANPGSSAVTATVTFYSDAGTFLGSTSIPSIAAHAKYTTYINSTVFSYLAGQGSGWYTVQASGNVASMLIFGDQTATPDEIGALVGKATSDTLYFGYWGYTNTLTSSRKTSFTVVNSGSASASVTMNIYSYTGTQIDSHTQSIPAKGKYAGFVNSVFSLGSAHDGYLVMSSTSSDLTGMELFDFSDLLTSESGVAAVEALNDGEASHHIYLPYYDESGSDWTLLAIANTGGGTAYPNLVARTTSGTIMDTEAPSIAHYGVVLGEPSDIF